jgi:hypothetical protein
MEPTSSSITRNADLAVLPPGNAKTLNLPHQLSSVLATPYPLHHYSPAGNTTESNMQGHQ